MTYVVLTDEDVKKVSSMKSIIQSIKIAFKERANQTLISLPRFNLETSKGNLVFTTGASTEYAKAMGFRVYDTFKNSDPNHQQLVTVFDSETGVFKGIIIGNLIGALRTGAIGGIAVDLMARKEATQLGIIGTGFQATTQLEAILTVRNSIEKVKVFSRNPERRKQFRDVMEANYNIEVIPAESAKSCVESSDIVICATTSRVPVIDASWRKAGTHVNTIGPKAINGHELPIEVALRSSLIATDSLEQLNGYTSPHFLANISDIPSIQDLSEYVVDNVERDKNDITLFCSVGLAGTEVVVANDIINQFSNT